jgi:acyl-coenzyme A thioesterase PaaI-like protein
VAVIAIHNEDWGFESNCFVCEPKNGHGLRIPFFHDTDTDVVFADFELNRDYSGAPSLVHGGLLLAILDEAMAWACIAVGRRWAVTIESSATFHGAVYLDKPHRVEARVGESTEDRMQASARIVDMKERVRTESRATFATLGEAQATRVIGENLGTSASEYLKQS